MVDRKKLVDGAIGGVLVGGAIAAKLADWGLTAADVVLSGAVNLTNSFVKAPKLDLGFKDIPKNVAKHCDTLYKKLLKKGMEKLR